MIKFSQSGLMALMVAGPAMLLMATPATAQNEIARSIPDEKINQLIIYGDDVCPVSTDDEIIVCARMDEAERYRIPGNLRNDPNNIRNETQLSRVKAYESVGASGTLSCSPSGAGGFTGCGLQEINKAYAEKSQDPGINFGRLIAAERAKRLAGIDAESAEVEERVVQFERERAEREARAAGEDFISEEETAAENAAVEDEGELPTPE